jgi:CspA family cold shock protein
MPIGTVKWFNPTKGYGFISPEDATQDVFVHITAVQRSGMTGLTGGQRLEYELARGRNGKMAADKLRPLD